MEIRDILKKLNKDKAEEDQIRISNEVSKDFFKREVISTGSPYLDYKINETIGKGGVVRGSYNMFIGMEGSAKTSIALIAGSKCQKELKKFVVYFDGESSISDSYLDRFGIDRDLFICYKGRNLEDMLDYAQQMSLADDVGMIIIDSIPIFVSTVVEEKTTDEYNMAVEARKFTARMPIIEGNCARRDIALLGLTFYTKDPGAMGDPRTVKRGAWQHLMSNLTLEFTKKDLIKDKSKKIVGHEIDVRIKKSKLNSYDKKDAFKINFYYDYGFNEIDEFTSIFIEEGIIVQKGAWFELPTLEKPIQGKASVVQFLKDNPEYFSELKNTMV